MEVALKSLFHPLKERNGRVKEGNTSYNQEYVEVFLVFFFSPYPKQNVGPSAVLKIGDKIIIIFIFIIISLSHSQGHCFCFVTLF